MVCFVLKTITCNTSLARRECYYYGSCGRYLPPRVNLTRIEYSLKQEETIMSWLITLEDLSAQEDNLYQVISLQEKKSAINNNNILNRQIPRMRIRPRQLDRISIHTRGQFSFWQAVSELQSNTCAHCSCPVSVQVWRRAAIAAAAARSYTWTISWLGFGLSDQLLLMHSPWGKVLYPLFGYLAQGLLPE